MDILYTLEDEVYFYAHCLQLGLCGYGESIYEAGAALMERVQSHFVTFYKNKQHSDYFAFPYDDEYFKTYQKAKQIIDTELAGLLLLHAETKAYTEELEERQVVPTVTFGKRISIKETRVYKLKQAV